MQGGIAQTIGLVLAANAKKRGLPTIGWPDGSIYTFCKKVQFAGRRSTGLLATGKLAKIEDPNRWLQTLPATMEAAQLNVFSRGDPNISDRESVGFANGGPVFVAQILGSETETWHGEWQVTDQSDKERRIWFVTYRNVAGTSANVPTRSSQEIRNELQAILDDAAQFSEKNNMGFAEAFRTAQKALDDRTPLADYFHADMIPDGLLTLEHAQTFACAAKAWVFGGMGSWNDVWFDGDNQTVYRDLSDRLFSAIIDALQLSTNASATEL